MILGVAFSVLALGGSAVMVVNAANAIPNQSSQTNYWGMGGMMGNGTNQDYDDFHADVAYEMFYTHLSSEEKTTVDAKYAELLMGIDFNSMTIEQASVALKSVKEETLAFFSGQSSETYYSGMMQGSTHCYTLTGITSSYEWFYMHLDETDRALVDAKYAELLLVQNPGTLTLAQMIAAITEIKGTLVTFIADSGFLQ